MDREEARKRAQRLVSEMTLSERMSQLRYDAPAIDRLGIPAYNWWNEALHGVARAGTATSFPQAIGMAAAFDEELMVQAGSVVGEEGRAKYNALSKEGDRDIYKGLTFWAPNVNIFRDPHWGRGQETYGEDPYLTSRLGVSYVRGIQGDGEYMQAAACAKHFAVHSGPEGERHRFNAVASKKDMGETYLPAFEALVREAGVEAVMGAYNRTNGEPCCGSPTLIGKILRGKWNFQGHYVSDCWAIRDFHEHHKVTKTPEESAALALNSGCDLNCGSTYQYLKGAYDQGLISEERITEACVRLYTTRFLLGLFDETELDDVPYTVVECDSHRQLARKAAEESMVLLKNDGILPLDISKIKTIGVIGPNADSRAALIGNYHGTSSRNVTVLQGIQEYVKEHSDENGSAPRVLYSEGCSLNYPKVENLASDGDRLAEAMTVAENSDVVILVVGLDETLEGEEGDTGNSYASGDKVDLLLPAPQRDLLRAVQETGTPTVLCLMAGSAIDLSFAQENFGAVLQLWYPGAEGGTAAARILFGEVSPSGKLDVTFYHDDDPLPDFRDYSMKGRTYRYFEGKPLYPFGYGLTYGDLVVTGAELLSEVKMTDPENGAAPVMRAAVRNDGKYATDDVVEVYVKALDSSLAPEKPRLCGFARVHLEAGAQKDVMIRLDRYTFTVIGEDGERKAGGNHFAFYTGTSQPDERSFELTGRRPVETMITI